MSDTNVQNMRSRESHDRDDGNVKNNSNNNSNNRFRVNAEDDQLANYQKVLAGKIVLRPYTADRSWIHIATCNTDLIFLFSLSYLTSYLLSRITHLLLSISPSALPTAHLTISFTNTGMLLSLFYNKVYSI